MASRQTISNSVTSDFIRSAARKWRIASAVLMLSSVVLSGCQQMPGGQAMRQYQLESDRLLNEFRAQKKRAEDLEVRNAQLEQRLAESEKQLASNNRTSGKSSKSRSETELLIGEANGERRNGNPLSESGSSPSTAGQLTSGSNRDPLSLGGGPRDLKGDRNRESQWRPVSDSQR